MNTLESGLSISVLAIVSTLIGSGLGYLLARPLLGRITRISDIIQAWNRGTLSMRIGDHSKDQVGVLANQLDQLAEHLEEDERDLEELRQWNMRLTDQVRALTVVEERNRLARELHESVKQHLFSLVMTASGIRTHLKEVENTPGEVIKMVEEVERSARAAQRETTRLIEDLRPGSLHEQGLAVSLIDFALLFGA
jgi:NarL family two-component system sensor histidine kinase LiaS